MRVTINGDEHHLADDATVADAVAVVGHGQGPGVAVALDGTVVTRAAWTTTPLTEGAALEVLTAVQGG